MDGPSTFIHVPLFRIGISGEEAEATDKVCNCTNTHPGTRQNLDRTAYSADRWTIESDLHNGSTDPRSATMWMRDRGETIFSFM